MQETQHTPPLFHSKSRCELGTTFGNTLLMGIVALNDPLAIIFFYV